MKVMITGAQGQLGKCLQDVLSGTEHEFIALGRAELDITDAEAVKLFVERQKPEIIINAAAYTAVDKAEAEPDLAFKVNAEAVANLAAAADDNGALLIHVSTDYVFNGDATVPYKESDLVGPKCVYGQSKLAGEKAASRSRRHIIVRTAWVFSEYGNNFLKTMVRLGHERDNLSIVNDQVGTPTYAGDLAIALIRLAERQPDNGIFHFSGGVVCSWYKFAQRIFEVCSHVSEEFSVPSLHPISTLEFPTSASRPAYSVLDGSKLMRLAGTTPGDWCASLERVCRKVLA